MSWERWLDDLTLDLRTGARSLAKYPVACTVAIMSLAGGIGATAATLTIREVVFRRPPVLYRDPGQLSRVQVGSPENPIRPAGNLVPGALYAIWQDALGATSGGTFAAATPERVREARTADRTETVRVRSVTPEFFSTLGVDAAVGRTFSQSGVPVVLSHRMWQSLFDGRPDAIGTTLWIDSQPYVVTGVMPWRFWFSSMTSPVWIPLERNMLASQPGLEVVVRRDSGVTTQAFEQRLERGLTEYANRLPAADRQRYLRVSDLAGTPLGQQVSVILPWLLGASVLLTLLIACANVAILVIAQWTAREQEIAIRASLGASRGRIVRAFVTESTLIASAGGVLGIGTMFGLQRLMIYRAGSAGGFFDLSVAYGALGTAMLITLGSGLVSGIGPALLETRRLHGNPMHGMAASERVRQRWRHTLVVLEIGVTVALLVVTGAMLNLYQRNFTANLGYRTRPMLSIRVENSSGVLASRVLDLVKQTPGVSRVAASTTIPFRSSGSLQRVSTDASGSQTVRAAVGSIDPEFFAALDVQMRAGRAFDGHDSPTTRTAIVNETLARRLFQGALGTSLVGARLWLNDTSYDIVGVVSDYKNNALQPPAMDPKLFLPLAIPPTIKELDLLVRASGDPGPVLNALRREVRSIAPGTVVASGVTFDQIIDIGGQEILVGTAPLVPLIATGLLLTAAGIYGVLAFSIARRSRELAVRVALGATSGDLVRLVSAHSARLLAIGALLGIGMTFGLSRVARAAGGGGSLADPDWPAFVVPVLIIAAIGALATWVPSRRARRIDPATILRTT